MWNRVKELHNFASVYWPDTKVVLENRVVICPLLYAPKFCDAKLSQTENHLPKIFRVNQWIKQFNEMNTGLHINLDEIGVKHVPESPNEKVEHIYGKFREKLYVDIFQSFLFSRISFPKF